VNCRRCGEILNANANFCWYVRSPSTRCHFARNDRRSGHQHERTLSPEANKTPKGEHRDELVIASGTNAGTRFELANEITSTGRHEASDILLDDVSVSRHHAIFTRTASGRITLRDLNSLNGTYVNGARVEETALHSADEVQIGKFKLVFWEATL
jgi:hypothetical protein